MPLTWWASFVACFVAPNFGCVHHLDSIQVHIAPLVNVSIQELPSENFDQRREARLQIKPKRISDRGDEIVSVRLEVCKPEESSLSEQVSK